MTGQHAPAPGLAGTQFCHTDNQYCGGRDANGDEMICTCCAAEATALIPSPSPEITPVADTLTDPYADVIQTDPLGPGDFLFAPHVPEVTI
jgi:hypothetical protein